MTSPFSTLDQRELIHVALDAIKRQDGGMALACLKEATARPDSIAISHFLLASQYAQLQMMDRAVEEFEAAIAMDPGLAIARFQLGLLLLSSGNAERANDVLTPLTVPGGDEALAHFANGLLHLIRDEFSETVRYLNEGIRLNTENAALNNDMQKIIDEIAKVVPQSSDAEENIEEESSAQHLLISAYTGKPSL